MLVTSYFEITGFHFTCKLQVSSLKCSLLLLGLLTESLDHTRLMGAQSKVKRMFVSSR